MEMKVVNSKTIARVGYDAASMELVVEFTSGKTYKYFDVPEITYEGLVRAGSVGEFFGARIRDRYRFVRL